MKDVRFGFGTKIVPLKGPVDTAATALTTNFVDLKNALSARFFVFFGNIAAASADQNITVTLEAATAAASGSEVAISGNYRLSGAVATDSWGAITAFTSSGISIDTTSADLKMLAMDVSLAGLDNLLADARFVRCVVTPDAGATATLAAIWCELDPTYPATTQLSAS